MAEYTVTSIAQLNTQISNSVAGDVIKLQDGTYEDPGTIDVDVSAYDPAPSSGNELTVQAETLGGVKFTQNTGRTYVEITGAYVIFKDFWFDSISTNVSYGNPSAALLRFVGATNCRVTNCYMFATGDGGGTSTIWFRDFSQNNRFDNNTIDVNGNEWSNMIEIYLQDSRNYDNYGNQIDRNIFKNSWAHNARGDADEAIRIGRGATSAGMRADTIVEYNYFYEWHGDSETISSKSSDNIIRYNVLHNCTGSIKLRQGNGAQVYGNYWQLDDDKDRDKTEAEGGYSTAAMEIKGHDHKVYNNYIYRGRIGIQLELGNPDLYEGSVTSDPADPNKERLVDSAAGWSDDEHNGMFVWMTSGLADGVGFAINDTVDAGDYLECWDRILGSTIDLYAAGVRSGDTYFIGSGDPDVRDLLLVNNSVIDNGRNGIECRESSHGTIKNNIVETDKDSGSYFCYQISSGASMTWTSNIGYSSGTMDVYGVGTSQTTPPAGLSELTANLTLANGIYRLQSGSTNAIEAGTTDANVTDDIDGESRDGSTPDIGCDEYSASPPSTRFMQTIIDAAGHDWGTSTPALILA